AADFAGARVNVLPRAVEELRMDLHDTLNRANVTGGRAENILKAIDTELPKNDNVGNLINLRNAPRGLGRDATSTILPRIESLINDYAPEVLAHRLQGEANYGAGGVLGRLDTRLLRADRSTSGILGNRIRAAALAQTSGPNARYLRPSDMDALNALSEGTRTQNALLGFSKAINSLPAHAAMFFPTGGIGNLLAAGGRPPPR